MFTHITSDETIEVPIWVEDPFPAFIADNVISEESCNELISSVKPLVKKHSFLMHGGRNFLPNTAIEFSELISKTEIWRSTISRLNNIYSKNFINHFKEKSQNKLVKKWLNSKKFKFTNSIYNLRSFLIRFRMKFVSNKIKSYQSKQVSSLNAKALLFVGVYSLINSLYRIIRSLADNISGYCNLTLLYDYSVSYDGYYREVHRDSDSRSIVFLLFLNSLETQSSGGSFGLYKSLNKSNLFQPQPDYSEEEGNLVEPTKGKMEKCKTHLIEPKAGRLIIFLNTSYAYHSVQKLKNTKIGNHFIYGGYTLPSNFGSIARKRTTKNLPTEFNLYR